MVQDEELLVRIGADTLSADDQERALEQLRTYIGEAMSETLTEQQLNEYQAIIDDDQTLITAWLDQHISDYKNAVLYQEFADAYDQDSERNSPEKLFASIAWVELNVPNRQEIIDRVIDNFKPDL